jgi:hypothetical protein
MKRGAGRGEQQRVASSELQGVRGGSGARLYSMQEAVRERGKGMRTNGQCPLMAIRGGA